MGVCGGEQQAVDTEIANQLGQATGIEADEVEGDEGDGGGAVSEDEDAGVERIVHALGRTGDERVVDDLAELLQVSWWDRLSKRAPPSELRVAAVWALGTLGCDSALAAVREALDDHDPKVRSAADAVIPESLDALP